MDSYELRPERAIFHHWIRPGLSELEDGKGAYGQSVKGRKYSVKLMVIAFSRERGTGCNDITCFNEVQKDWGLERPNYAPIMFEWERQDRKDPTYRLENLYLVSNCLIATSERFQQREQAQLGRLRNPQPSKIKVEDSTDGRLGIAFNH